MFARLKELHALLARDPMEVRQTITMNRYRNGEDTEWTTAQFNRWWYLQSIEFDTLMESFELDFGFPFCTSCFMLPYGRCECKHLAELLSSVDQDSL